MTTLRSALSAQPRLDLSINREFVLIGVLGFITLLGVLAGGARLLLGLGATTSLNDAYSWGIWIGFDFLLIALSGAGFTMAAVTHVLHRHQFDAAMRPAILAGFVGYVAVLVLLVLDLGRPDRFYHFLYQWNIHSPLFEISWCILLYSAVLAVEVSPYLFERLGWRRPVRWFFRLMTPITILGVTLSSLHQSTLGTLYLNMPHRLHELWYTPALPLLFFVSSILAGLSVAILAYMIACRAAKRPVESRVVDGLSRAAGWVALLYLTLKLGELLIAGELAALFAFDTPSLLLLAELGIGCALPMLLLLFERWRQRPLVRWIAPALFVFGIGMNRFNATLLGQTLPFAGNYTPHLLEWVSTAGVLAAAALAWYLGVRLLVIFEDRASAHRR